MPYDEELTKEILRRADIVDVVSKYRTVIKKGKNYVATCPFHEDHSPSLVISPEKKMCHCFVCGGGGNAITFVQKYLHISYTEAMRETASIIGFVDERLYSYKDQVKKDNKKETMLKCLNDLTSYYSYMLSSEEGMIGKQYFESRHLDASLQSKYRLGYAPENGQLPVAFLTQKGHSVKTMEDCGIVSLFNNEFIDKNRGRVIFPIFDEEGKPCGFSARRIKDSDEAKYVNTAETYVFHKSSILYNYYLAKDKARIAGHIYVCEGFMDIFALGRIGIDNAVATMGTALTKEHVELLRKLNVEIRLCFDGDAPGQEAAMKTSRLLEQSGLNCLIVNNQGSPEDPDEILNRAGPDALRAYLNNLLNRVDFALNYFARTNPLKTSEQKTKLVKQFIPILLSIKNRLEYDSCLHKLANVTGYDYNALNELLEKSRNQIKSNDKEGIDKIVADFHPERKALRRLELAERELLYQMVNNSQAVTFYEQNVFTFYDEVYRKIANFLIDYSQNNPDYIPADLISALEASNIDDKDALIKEIYALYLGNEKHPNVCTETLLKELNDSIKLEKERIYEQDVLKNSLKDKDPLEQARILAEHNQSKVKKLEKKEGKK